VDQAIDLIIQEIARFTNEPVSDTELSDSQANFIGRLPLSLETNAGVANALTNLERYQLGLDHYHEFAAQVRAVTPGEIRAAARRYLDPGRLGIAVAGPGREKK
jgi:zinc protease